MKTRHFLFTFLLFAPFFAAADIQLDKSAVQIERSGDLIFVTLPFECDATGPVVDDMTVTLLDENYQALAQLQKKVFLLGGRHEETVALPAAANAPDMERCRVRVDFLGNTWLKQFSPEIAGHEIHLIGQMRWIAGSEAAVRIIVTRSDNAAPVEKALIQTKIFSDAIHEAFTDADGIAQMTFDVPDKISGSQNLQITVKSPHGESTLISAIDVVPGTKIFLSTDKPVYQPNQVIHIRALAAHKSSGEPLPERSVQLEIFDGKGNKVFKKEETTSEFGIVSADFQLADEVNQGEYRIQAVLQDEISEKTVQVYEYVLPKFRVNIKTDEKYYAPGDEVTGSVEARYFFGKPAAEAKVKITANCFDVGFNEFAKTEVVADEEGRAEYAFTIPDRLVGQPQFKGSTIVQMDVRVSDAAGHEEQKYHTFHVAVDPLQIEAIPESGRLIPGVENEIFLVASTPDGGAVQPQLTVRSKYLEKPLAVQCDENGIASIRLTPQQLEETGANLTVQNVALPQPDLPPLYISAEFNGKNIDVAKDLSLESGEAQLLLRVNQGVYRVGDVMEITALSAAAPSESVFLDIIKNGQTILTRTMRLKDGRSSLSLPIDNQLAGSLTLNGYIIGSGGTMVRDARQVVALRNDDLRIEIAADQEQYEPGRPAQLKIAVTNGRGEPVRAALGMHIVDESVYSLTEKEPGLAKVFFAIERELLEPKVEIHGFQLDKVVRLSADDYRKNADLSKALLAKLDAFSEYGLQIDTAREKEEQANRDLNQIRGFTQWQMLPAVFQPLDVAEAMLFLQQKPDVVPNTDPWGRSYKFLIDQEEDDSEKENIFLVSNGRDGVLGTQDDIRLKNYNSPVVIMQASFALNDQKRIDQVQSQNGSDMVGADSQSVEFDTTFRGRDANQEGFHFYFFAQQPMDNLKVGGLSQFVKTAAGAVGGIVEEAPLLRDGLMRRGGMGMGGMGMAKGVDGVQNGEWGMAVASAPPAPDEGGGRALGVEFEMQDASGLQEHNLWFKEDAVALREKSDVALGDFAEKKEAFPNVHVDFYRYGDDLSKRNEIRSRSLLTDEELQDVDLDVVEQLKSLGYAAGDDFTSGAPLVAGGRVDLNQLQQWMEKFNAEEDLFQEEREQIAMLINKIRDLSSDEKEEIVKSQKSVRVRRYFPETLFYTPETITDDNGFLALNLPMADSITTWRMSAMANAKNGALGDATAALKVFKPFFIDLDLPVALIQHDEVTIPVAVYNYLPKTQAVKIDLAREPWFKLLEGDYQRTITIAADEVTSVTYRIRADQLGRQPITVYAWGSEDNDAIGKTIEVRPNGAPQFITRNGRLSGSVKETAAFPANRVEGADKLFVKIYPGIFSQVVEGMDAILQMPYGCFEQTSSTTYPNVLALQYMKQTGKITPAVEMKAREYINLGYQRLLTFEIDGGGFQVFGNPPATRILSAYGLLEFTDMSQVHPVDANVIERTKRWLMGQMMEDGSWAPDEHYAHAEMWKSIQDNKVLATAYTAMALAQTGMKDQLSRTRDYLVAHADEAEDAYTLAILCNSLLAMDPANPATKRCVNRLVDLGVIDGDQMYWKAEASMSFARGPHAWVEATAWAALALIEDGRFPQEIGKILNWIIDQKDPSGAWGTTHGTVLALKALINALGKQTQQCDAVVLVHVNGEEAARLEITPETSDIFRQLDLTEFAGQDVNQVEIDFEGEGSLLYQVVGKYFVPWKIDEKAASQPFKITVEYDRSQLRRNDTVTCQIKAANTRPFRVEMVMIDIGVPPGFRVEQPAMDEYVENGVIAKYSLTPRQLIIYVESMEAGQTIQLDAPMKATLPMVAKAPESTMYEYYNPEQ
ncbi:MAG: hypothetical protein JXR73_20400, partial [Candidatus Omnitrophica bacterium]|nr:hypothetical protein [Candidatus Omnitrophota bacterium]